MNIPVTVYQEVKQNTSVFDLPVSMGTVAAGEAEVVREGDKLYVVTVVNKESA